MMKRHIAEACILGGGCMVIFFATAVFAFASISDSILLLASPWLLLTLKGSIVMGTTMLLVGVVLLVMAYKDHEL